jgi:hypothetical protein
LLGVNPFGMTKISRSGTQVIGEHGDRGSDRLPLPNRDA